jgi:ubiquinone/menaquinone biosynthesis C-methylase UbiE
MISLGKIQSTWESLAKHDALWAVLTDGSKVGGKWDIAEFMATGEAEIETVMGHLARIGCVPDPGGMALDFGCGVGRLTQALSRRFTSCVGLDISQQMIQKAESLNEHKNCKYVASSALRLPFPDASFSFIYSNIVLQHMPQCFSTAYLSEFVRTLSPRGMLVFGVQDSFIASRLVRLRQMLRVRSMVKVMLRLIPGILEMHCLSEGDIRSVLGPARIMDIQFTATAAKEFNGQLIYLKQPPRSGYVGKQYCVRQQL